MSYLITYYNNFISRRHQFKDTNTNKQSQGDVSTDFIILLPNLGQ